MDERFEPGDAPDPAIDAGRLWAGGLATAVVAALVAVAGILFSRGLLGIAVLAPKGAGVWGTASTGWYALGAALAALAATGLVHLLVLFAPRPLTFFGWVIALVTVVAVLAPFLSGADRAAMTTTAVLNLVLGLAIGSLVSASARGALRTTVVP